MRIGKLNLVQCRHWYGVPVTLALYLTVDECKMKNHSPMRRMRKSNFDWKAVNLSRTLCYLFGLLNHD